MRERAKNTANESRALPIYDRAMKQRKK